MEERTDPSAGGRIKTLLVTAAVCLVCSIVVSASAVLLRPYQQAHRERERSEHIAALTESLPEMADLIAGLGVQQVETRIVDLTDGTFADDVDAATFDQRKAALDPERSTVLADDRDPAGIGRRERYAEVYLVRRGGRIELIILPVRGSGYESMMYGYVALAGDGNTIRGFTIYEQGETPGLGAGVAEPAWLAQWKGKRVRDAGGNIRVRVVTEQAQRRPEDAQYEVDGISGATWTSTGVTDLLRFWLGPDGFEPFLRTITEPGES